MRALGGVLVMVVAKVDEIRNTAEDALHVAHPHYKSDFSCADKST